MYFGFDGYEDTLEFASHATRHAATLDASKINYEKMRQEDFNVTRIAFLVVLAVLLTACASQKTKQNPSTNEPKPDNQKSILELMLGITVDPNEKNPLFYELPGIWKLAAAGDDCEKQWQEVKISNDKTTLSIARTLLKDGKATLIERTYFLITESGKDYLKLQTKHNQKPIEEYWTLARPNIIAFALMNNKTKEITPTWTRCTKIGVLFEGEISKEAFENLDLEI